MEHQFGPPVVEHRAHPGLVADIGDQRLAMHLRVGLGELGVDLPQRVFAVVEQDQRLRPEGGDLAGELRADGAAGAGDDNAAALDQPRHALTVERHLGAVEQIVDHHRAQFQPAPRAGVAGAGGAKRGGARHAAQRKAEAVGLVDQARQRRPAKVGRGDDDGGGQPVLRGEAVEHCRHVVDAAQDGVALDPPATLAGADGEQAGDLEALPAILRQRAQQQVQVFHRANQQQGGGVARIGPGAGAAELVLAVEHAGRAEQGEQGERVHHREGRAGQCGAGKGQRGSEQRGTEHRGTGDGEQVGQAGEAPVLQREPQRRAGQQQGGRAGGDGPGRRERVGGGGGDPMGKWHGQRSEAAIEGDIDGDSHDGSGGHAAAYRPRG